MASHRDTKLLLLDVSCRSKNAINQRAMADTAFLEGSG